MNTNLEKSEWINQHKLLLRDLKQSEKEEKYWTAFKRSEDKEILSLYETNSIYLNQLKHEKLKISEIHNHICAMINRFKKELKTMQLSKDALSALKSLIEEINARLSGQKKETHFKLEEFNNEEKLLLKEIEVYDRKIQMWLASTAVNNNNEERAAASANESLIRRLDDSKRIPEVLAFDKYLLQNGGHDGGWDMIDHSLFLKIRNKHKGKSPDFVDELLNLVATKSREQIEDHEKWHETYVRLNEAKKQAIYAWKEARKLERDKHFNEAEAEIRLHKEIDKVLDEATRKKRATEREKRLQRLNEWKLVKEIEAAKKREEQLAEEKRRLEIEQKKFEEQMKVKEKVIEYKQVKERLNEFMELENYLQQETVRQVKRVIAREVIDNFQDRDFSIIQSKVAKTRAKQREKEEKERRILELSRAKSDMMQKQQHDPARLYQMTTSWKSRITTSRSARSENSCERPMAVHSMPRLAVPSWRQNI